MEIGTGGIDRYVPVEDGDTLELARGCQGGQHLWIGLRAYGLDTQPALISLSAVRATDGEVVSIPTTVRLRFRQDDGYDEITGIQLIIPTPNELFDRDIDINARVAEDISRGRMARTTRRVDVVWGDEVCGGALGDGGVRDADGGLPDGAVLDADVDGGEQGDAAVADAAATDA